MQVAVRAGLLSTLFVLGLGCDDDPGRVLVVVDTDFDVPGELSAVRVVVRRTGAADQTREIPVSRRAPTPHRDPVAVPLSFVVAARDDESRDFEVTVSGLSATTPGEVLVTRRAITSFLPERTLLLPMFLLRSCSEVVCTPDQTCFDGSCVDPRVPAQTLVTVQEPGRELTNDAGVATGMDAGVARDAGGTDAGTRDAGACTFGPPEVLISRGSDWDPTLTEDETVLVWRDGDTSTIELATRATRTDTFRHIGGLPMARLETPSAPALSADGLRLIVDAALVPGGVVTLYELSRPDRSSPFAGPVSVVMGAPAHEPGLDRSGLNLVALADVSGEFVLFAGSRGVPSGPFTTGRVIDELAAYDPQFPALSGDGLTLAFTSNFGRTSDDIFLARRDTIDAPFGVPVPLDVVNTPDHREHDPWLNVDGSAIYFSSERAGDWNLYVAHGSCF